ncbi:MULTISPECIES: H-type small acid-soluble spore protein [Sporomusa]|jgi:small acid-soluble spore protein H (minor)|uniref:Acid-soluble spore protein H n=2 Tax=Sporomusa TaxID=2375 RepID=A0ABM9W1L9_9FIRM|nr:MULTISPECIES: H-type small acid-soluble spore protein [Sporomusa]MCM0761370.1 H-type small acid-soluble spore protein [Sporomusa sphaeroides DSM 2875]OLS56619.1 small, acid-soluble spore protein H [Sporomusa sphaeroides DSM 2875]CVK19013.1 acid-soluble spore protein H [Sporomusa sphaeroides DSM 2875]SCM82119.1 Small acid-soluble spore protein, H-type [uncultured Sporomusa sp.]HML32614.1 H-type small acid-soluble spore protein [Sporomusa sphaeroides]
MNASRAEQILKSPDTIGVKYRNNYVWIENVDKGRNTAYVTYLEKHNTVHVDIDQLEETGPMPQH